MPDKPWTEALNSGKSDAVGHQITPISDLAALNRTGEFVAEAMTVGQLKELAGKTKDSLFGLFTLRDGDVLITGEGMVINGEFLLGNKDGNVRQVADNETLYFGNFTMIPAQLRREEGELASELSQTTLSGDKTTIEEQISNTLAQRTLPDGKNKALGGAMFVGTMTAEKLEIRTTDGSHLVDETGTQIAETAGDILDSPECHSILDLSDQEVLVVGYYSSTDPEKRGNSPANITPPIFHVHALTKDGQTLGHVTTETCEEMELEGALVPVKTLNLLREAEKVTGKKGFTQGGITITRPEEYKNRLDAKSRDSSLSLGKGYREK